MISFQFGAGRLWAVMKRVLKRIIPLVLRVKMKWVKAAWSDLTGGALPPRVPPRRQTFIGGGDFVTVGDSFLEQLKDFGLTPDMSVLDVGCGQGRMARPLVDFLSPQTGRYNGFDIVKSGIDWCRHHYADVPNFTFHHANIINARYNAGGDVAAKDYIFPYADDSFDMIFLTSVFTHMFKEDAANYLAEIQRVLKPGGRSVITWFIMRQGGSPDLDFAHQYDDVTWTTLKSNPEAALAFDKGFILDLYRQAGFQPPQIHEGHWATKGGRSYQDMIVADG